MIDRHSSGDSGVSALSSRLSSPASHYASSKADLAWLSTSAPSTFVSTASVPLPVPAALRPASLDVDARRSLWTSTAAAGLLGGTAGAAWSIYSGYPLHRAVAQAAFNWSLVTFTFVGSSLLCSELVGLPSSSLPNHVLSGSLTFGSLLSLQAASQGRITSLTSASRIGARAAAVGAVCGVAVWSLQRGASWWRTTSSLRRERQHEEMEQHELEQSQEGGSDAGSSGGWMPPWSPVRVATDADLARAERVKAERKKRAHELQQQRREQQRQQRQYDKESQLD